MAKDGDINKNYVHVRLVAGSAALVYLAVWLAASSRKNSVWSKNVQFEAKFLNVIILIKAVFVQKNNTSARGAAVSEKVSF